MGLFSQNYRCFRCDWTTISSPGTLYFSYLHCSAWTTCLLVRIGDHYWSCLIGRKEPCHGRSVKAITEGRTVPLSLLTMMDSATPLTASTISVLAFQKSLEAKSDEDEVVKKFTEAEMLIMDQLRQKLWEKLRGKPEAEKALASAERGFKAELENVAAYLQVAMVEDPVFAEEMRVLAQGINAKSLVDQSSMSSMSQNGTAFKSPWQFAGSIMECFCSKNISQTIQNLVHIVQIAAFISAGFWAYSRWDLGERASVEKGLHITGEIDSYWSDEYKSCTILFQTTLKNVSKRDIEILKVEYYFDQIPFNPLQASENYSFIQLAFDDNQEPAHTTDYNDAAGHAGLLAPNEFSHEGFEILYRSDPDDLTRVRADIYIPSKRDEKGESLTYFWDYVSLPEECKLPGNKR